MFMAKKRKEALGPMPSGSAGLLRFFEEETKGIKIRPEILVAIAIVLIVVSVALKVYFPVTT
jgi:preprotein translocase subunit Sec61beta